MIGHWIEPDRFLSVDERPKRDKLAESEGKAIETLSRRLTLVEKAFQNAEDRFPFDLSTLATFKTCSDDDFSGPEPPT